MTQPLNQNKMESAVEWLAKELYEKFEMRGDGILYDEILDQAKEMYKEQIIDAFNKVYMGTGEEYYNETFNK